MGGLKNGQKLSDLIADPVQRLEVLIDGSEDLGIVGIRARTRRLERMVILALLLNVVDIGTSTDLQTGLLGAIVQAVIKLAGG